MRGTFAERMDAKTYYDPNTGCWLWLGAIGKDGYGYTGVGRRGTGIVAVHIATYQLEVGSVPRGLELDHLCRTRSCRSPYHLQPVTHRVNVLRGVGLSAQYAVRTACKNGHSFTEANTFIHQGARRCRICARAYQRRRKERGR